jgi:16S rRNA (cytidine1402-2'-O)-methyltransferase
MSNKGNLFLIPNIIAENTEDKIVTPQLRALLPGISHFLAENIRTARRFLSSLKVYDAIEPLEFSMLDKNTTQSELPALMSPVLAGLDMGIISESGCPGIADPGALAVKFAHEHQIKVIPLVGPSSIFLALMASGLNGQNFSFHGYLSIEQNEASLSIKSLEKESRARSQTQIFIETPYRNNSILQTLVKNLSPDTLLTIAIDITGLSERIETKSVKKWRTTAITLPKTPAVFLFLA